VLMSRLTLKIQVIGFTVHRAKVPSHLNAREVADDSPSISVLSKLRALFSAHVDNSAKHGVPGNEKLAVEVTSP
jgi:hypothetical protein